MNRNYEEAEEYGVREVTVGDRYMKKRRTEKRYSAAPLNRGPRERRKERAMRISEK